MNKFLTAMAFAIAVGSTPALAQSWDPDVGSGNIAPPPYGETNTGASIYQQTGFNAYAQATPVRHMAPRHGAALDRSNQVVDDNQVVGTDPDVNVRSELARDNKETEF